MLGRTVTKQDQGLSIGPGEGGRGVERGGRVNRKDNAIILMT